MFTKVVYTENYLPDLLGLEENGFYSLNFKRDLVSKLFRKNPGKIAFFYSLTREKIFYSNFETKIGWNASKP
jgi:hypothetical protein